MYKEIKPPPFGLILLLLISVPLIEIYFLLRVGSQIGALSTIALVVVTAIIGAFLLRLQGVSTLARVQAAVGRGELPAAELIEGLILLLTGVLLLTPGFFTDAMGFLCLIPTFRHGIATRLIGKIIPSPPPDDPQARKPHDKDGGSTLEGEFWRDDE